MININKLRGKIVENGMTVGDVAERMGINRSTLYRKMQSNAGDTFTIGEARAICKILNLSTQDATDIFLAVESHTMRRQDTLNHGCNSKFL